MLFHALKYLEMGYPIFPINFDGRVWRDNKWEKIKDKEKSPLIVTDPYWRRLPTEDEVREWWTRWPWAAIALACGELSGITVIDTETEADRSLFGLDDIETPTALSGSGGKHYYFKYAKDVPNRVKFAPYYDIRSERGYIIVPPSAHISGGKYEWIEPIGAIELADFPLNVKNAVGKTNKSSREELERLMGTGVKAGERNVSATKVAGSLLARYPQNQWATVVWPVLQMWNKEKNNPPEEEDALFKTFESICRSELAKRNAQGKKDVIFNLNPQVKKENGTFTIEYDIEDAKIRLDYDQSDFGKSRALDTQLTASYILLGFDPIQISARININSLSARSQMVTELTRAFGKNYPWALMLANSAPLLSRHLKDIDQPIQPEDVDLTLHKDAMLLDPFVIEKSHNLVFADGSSGKSTLISRLAISLSSGLDFLDYKPRKMTKVLYLDYEDNKENFTNRLLKLASGMSKMPDDLRNIYYYHAHGIPLIELLPKLREMIKKFKIEVLIIDSVAYACGAELEKAEIAVGYFNSLDQLDVTTISIAHVSKGSTESDKSQKYAIGSIFFHNGPRNIWNLKAQEQDEDAELTGDSALKKVCLYHRKNNLGLRHKAIPLEIAYGHEDRILITYGSFDDWKKHKKAALADSIVNILRNTPLTRKELLTNPIFESYSESYMDKELSKLKTSGIIESEGYGKPYIVKNCLTNM